MSERIRSGYYAKVNGKDMEIYEKGIKHEISIVSYAPEDDFEPIKDYHRRKGYKPNEWDKRYIKVMKTEEFKQKIKDGEIGEVYSVSSHAIYRKKKVSVHTSSNWDGKNVWISTTDGHIAYICEIDQVDRGEYQKEVPLSEVEIIETIKPVDISKW